MLSQKKLNSHCHCLNLASHINATIKPSQSLCGSVLSIVTYHVMLGKHVTTRASFRKPLSLANSQKSAPILHAIVLLTLFMNDIVPVNIYLLLLQFLMFCLHLYIIFISNISMYSFVHKYVPHNYLQKLLNHQQMK